MNHPPSAPLVSPAWLDARRDDANLRLIEIAGTGQEDMAAYKAGHVPGAICWLWQEKLWDSHKRDFPDGETFARRMGEAGIANDTTVVFYGEDIQFGIYAWWVLTYCGHQHAKILNGGRYRWQAEGRPLTVEVPAPASPVDYQPSERNETMRIRRDGVLAAVEKGEAAILDARSPEEYSGERVGGPGGPDIGALRYGRIPGARHIYYLDLLDDTKRFRPPDELASELRARNVGAGDEIITYCRMSHRATAVYFALTRLLGFKNVRVYDGSWTEWGNLVDVPIER